MICIACEAPNDEAARSCIACGQPLVAGAASPAAEALGEIGPLVAAASKALKVAAKDPEPDVRKSALQALATIGPVVGSALTALEDVPGNQANPRRARAAAEAHRRTEAAGR